MTRATLRIVRGAPTAEEVAVVTALVNAAGSGLHHTPESQRGRWNDPVWRLRRPLQPGPGAWRAAR